MKLLPRIHRANFDRWLRHRQSRLYSLRRQVGIVPQDPLLFSGSVVTTLLTNPDASSDSIVEAAQLACAHEFVMELPATA